MSDPHGSIPSLAPAELDCSDVISAHQAQLLRYCEFLSASQYDAQDLAQTTLLKVLPMLNGQRYHPNLPALLRRIAKTTWLDHVRRLGKNHLCDPDELTDLFSADLVDHSRLEEALQMIVQTLTPKQRAVVLLCDVFQYTDREVGTLLGISHGAVKAALHRARLRLEPIRNGVEVLSGMDEFQKEILEAYVSAFQSADMRMLVQLCQDGVVDPIQATSKVLTFSQKPLGVKTSDRLSMCMAA